LIGFENTVAGILHSGIEGSKAAVPCPVLVLFISPEKSYNTQVNKTNATGDEGEGGNPVIRACKGYRRYKPPRETPQKRTARHARTARPIFYGLSGKSPAKSTAPRGPIPIFIGTGPLLRCGRLAPEAPKGMPND
jgi:hypothetical protein